MSKQTSTMVLANLTVVDHAYIDNRGNVVGGSFNPSFFVTGEIDPVEHVVVDFSAVKKQIKQIIDDKQTGFDHKLWFISGYSAGTMSLKGNTVIIETPTTLLTMPLDAVIYISGSEYTTEVVGNWFADKVERKLRRLHPSVNIDVVCSNNTTCHFPTSEQSASMFRYAHGLKDSTSWGCKNIAHGHLSYIQLFPVTAVTTELAAKIADDLDDCIFINKENIKHNNSAALSIGYTTERGVFAATYSKDNYKLIMLETETTVENLVEYVVGAYNHDLADAGVNQVLVSEGLSKGAVVTL